VLVTARVQRQIARLFVAEKRGTQALKGYTSDGAVSACSREWRRLHLGSPEHFSHITPTFPKFLGLTLFRT
jgi:hypothetical protein